MGESKAWSAGRTRWAAAGGVLLVGLLSGCPRVSLPALDKAGRYEMGAERGRSAGEELPEDHVDARITDMANGQRVVAWSTCDAVGCEARVGFLQRSSAEGPAEVSWSQALRFGDATPTGVRIDGIQQADLDDDGEGELVVMYSALEGETLASRRLAIYDPVALRLATVLELERGPPQRRSCVLYVVDVNSDDHRDLVFDCSDSARPQVRVWRRSRDEWR